MKKRTFLLACALLGVAAVSAQEINNAMQDQKMLPKSDGGNNASIGNIYSPSLFDGSANVNIPIYQFKNDYGSFGVSLNYNTKGVRVDELSGPVGTHWDLNAAGAITRTTRDLPDEIDFTVQGHPTTHRLVGKAVQYGLAAKGATEYWDGMNDDYTVSAGNLNFTFKLGKNGYIYTYPISRAKIIKTPPPASASNQNDFGFIITDVDGVQYEFDVCEHTDDNFQTGVAPGVSGANVVQLNYISKWKIVRITFPNGQSIKYNYQASGYPGGLYLYRSRGCKEGKTATGSLYSTSTPSYIVNAASSTNLQQSFTLDSINYPNNVTAIFDFDQNPAITNYWQCLKSIKKIRIKEGDNTTSYLFNKKYLTRAANVSTSSEVAFDNACDYNDVNTGGRLLLKSITTSNEAGITEPYYSFEYSTTLPSSRTSDKVDFFGYCNGVGISTGTITSPSWPTHQNPFNTANTPYFGGNRNVASDINLVSALSLVKVNNAYGGSVTFKYDAHVLANQIPNLPTTDPLFVGLNANDGQRLKSITATDKYYPNNSKITTYTYSGGQFFLNGGYFSYPSSMDVNNVINEYTTTTNWISPHQLINGSNHGYSNVVVETRNNAGALLSKTAYQFSNFKDDNMLRYLPLLSNGKHYYQAPFTDKQYIKDWEIGLLKSVTNYDQNGNIISRTKNHYSNEMIDQAVILNGLQANVNNLKKSFPTGSVVNILTLPTIASDNFIPVAGRSLLDTTITENFYNDALTLNDTVTYQYDFPRRNLMQTTIRNSKGEYFLYKKIYNYTVIEAGQLGSLPSSNALNTLTAAGIEKVISTETWKKGSSATAYGDVLHDAFIYVYGNQTNKIWTQRLYSLRSLNAIPYTTYTGLSMGGPIVNPYGSVINAYKNITPNSFQQVSQVLQNDGMCNPTETQLAGVNAYKAMIWDTKTNQKIAEANCKLNEMACSSFECNVTGNWNYNVANSVDVITTSIGAIDGKKILKIYNYETAPLSVAGLTPNKEYILTFWCNGNTPTITGGGLANIPLTLVTAATDPTNSGWKFYQARFTPISSAAISFLGGLTASTIFCYLDDARIFPAGAQMNSWTYKPLFGPGTSTDPSGRITYFEYDAFGRPTIIRNQEGAIVSKKEYLVGQ